MMFYCCDKLQESKCVGRPYNIELDDNNKHFKHILPYFEICDEYDCEVIDFCPFCGSKLSKL